MIKYIFTAVTLTSHIINCGQFFSKPDKPDLYIQKNVHWTELDSPCFDGTRPWRDVLDNINTIASTFVMLSPSRQKEWINKFIETRPEAFPLCLQKIHANKLHEIIISSSNPPCFFQQFDYLQRLVEASLSISKPLYLIFRPNSADLAEVSTVGFMNHVENKLYLESLGL